MKQNLKNFNLKQLEILSRIVAHLMGDGHVSRRYFAYYNKNDKLLELYERDILALFGDVHIIRGKVNSGTKLIQVQNKKIIDFLFSILKDYRSHSLTLPAFLNTSELKSEFLKSFYDDEGCVALRVFKKTGEIKRSITLASKSQEFLKEIKVLLNNDFSIATNKICTYNKRMGEKYFSYSVLTITGKENFLKFQEKINFNHPEKREKLSEMIDSYIRK